MFDEAAQALAGRRGPHRRGVHRPLPGRRRSGCSRRPTCPTFPGATASRGTLVHTNAWPEDLDITGKRVGVIGTGSTGTQFIVAAAKQSPAT